MSVNLTRGLIRAWLVFSCLWVLVAVWLCSADVSSKLKTINALESGPIASNARLLSAAEFDARHQTSFVADDKIVLEIKGTKVLVDKSFASTNTEDENEIVDIVASKLGIVTQTTPRLPRLLLEKISSSAPWIVGVPVFIFVLGAMLRWILLGFKTVS